MATRTRDAIFFASLVLLTIRRGAKLELKGESGVLFSDDHRKWQDDGYHVS